MKFRLANSVVIGLSILLIINGIGSFVTPDENIKVSFIGVGDGESILIQVPDGFNILIDGGSIFSDGEIVLDYLRNLGVSNINVMVVTHAHSLAYGGLIDVLEARDITVESVLYNGYPGAGGSIWRRFEEAVFNKGLTLTTAQYPQSYTWGSSNAQILNPLPGLADTEVSQEINDRSLVILLEYGNVRFLFTGDINANIENDILSREVPVEADILKVPFRGYQNSLSTEFLSAVQPREAVIFVGNRFEPVERETISQLNHSGVRIWLTNKRFITLVESDGHTYEINSLGLSDITLTTETVTTLQTETTLAPTVIPTLTPTATSHPLILWFQENRQQSWFKPLSALSGFFIILVVGSFSLLIWASQVGSAIFDRHWLISLAAKPLLITPGLGRWSLFLGYKRRLKMNPAVAKAAKDYYFGLPAVSPKGDMIKPDPKGDALHTEIVKFLGPQQPVLLEGRGGAGKSTLLARLVYLGLTRNLSKELDGYRPILVTPAYYRGNLIQAIASVLRERDGIAANDAIVQSQLGSGNYLVLFDGVSEIDGDKDQSMGEILRTARNADYSRCRFLVTTRPLGGVDRKISSFELKPLTPTEVQNLLPNYRLGYKQEYLVKRQLESFGDKPIEPLLFSMILGQGEIGEISQTRAQLYERYFRRLLQVEKHEDWWRGWRRSLEVLAQWFMLDTGKRGVGLSREPLLNRMRQEDNNEWPSSKSLVEMLQANYKLPVQHPLDMLQRLKAAGILIEERRWRFAHDTFEEYFAASRVVSVFDLSEQWPPVKPWMSSGEQVQDFLEVMEFVREIGEEDILSKMANSGIPTAWRTLLLGDDLPTKNWSK